MKTLLIIGAGSFSTEVEELARLLGYTDFAFVDDNPAKAHCLPVVGCMSDIPILRTQYSEAIVALGNNDNRVKYHKVLKAAGFFVPSLIHPTAYISPDAVVSSGCIIRSHAVVSRYVRLGEAVIVNVGAMIDHDCTVGMGSHLLMGAVVRNKVFVPEKTWINANQVVE